MKILSWNVNGIRAAISKGFFDFVKKENPDIICIQETKMSDGQADINIEGYDLYMNSSKTKKGYSGTAIYTKVKPKCVKYDMGIDEHDMEGRIILLEFDDFYLVNVYVPNSRRDLVRLEYRMKWEDDMRQYLLNLKDKKNVIMCGDLNVAHQEIDLKNPSSNHHNAGFTDEERNKMSCLLNSGFIDTFRYLYKDKKDAYTWWSYMAGARSKNIGWRIDYFIVSCDFIDKIEDSYIYSDVLGSDHCPIGITVK